MNAATQAALILNFLTYWYTSFFRIWERISSHSPSSYNLTTSCQYSGLTITRPTAKQNRLDAQKTNRAMQSTYLIKISSCETWKNQRKTLQWSQLWRSCFLIIILITTSCFSQSNFARYHWEFPLNKQTASLWQCLESMWWINLSHCFIPMT